MNSSNKNNFILRNRPTNLCCYEEYRKEVEWVLEQMPQKIKDKYNKFLYSIMDIIPKNPSSKIHNEVLGFVYDKFRKRIYLTIKAGFSQDAIRGLIIHEIAHSYIGKYPNPIRKLIFKLKYDNMKIAEKPHHYEELYANWLAKKWGFSKEIDAIDKERRFDTNAKVEDSFCNK